MPKPKRTIDDKPITKSFRAEVREIDEANHRVLVTMSDETVDSYGEIIDVTGWEAHLERFNAHPVLLSSHTYNDLRKQIGETEKIFVQDGKLMAWQKYYVDEGNDEADWAWNLAKKRIAAYSVGFKPIKVMWFGDLTEEEMQETRLRYKLRPEQKVGRIFLEQELLENSQVVIPSNPNSLQESLKDADMVVVKAAEDLMASIKTDEAKQAEELETKKWEDQESWTEIRYRVRDPELFVRIRRAKMPGVAGVAMLVGPLKSDPEGGTKIQALRFSKPSWTLEKAKKWVSEHPDVGKGIDTFVEKELEFIEEVKEPVKEDAQKNPPDEPITTIDPDALEIKEMIKLLSETMTKTLTELVSLVKSLATEKAGNTPPCAPDEKSKDAAKDSDIFPLILSKADETQKILKSMTQVEKK